MTMSNWYGGFAIGMVIGTFLGIVIVAIIDMGKKNELNMDAARRFWRWMKSGGKERRRGERRKGDRRCQ